jgi:2-dehydropantoate 2-reductase
VPQALDLLIVGSGAIGCYVGARLQHAGRLKIGFYLRAAGHQRFAHGLRVTDWQGFDQTLSPEDVLWSDQLADFNPRMIVLAVKSTATLAAGAAIVAQFGGQLPVWSLQNGVENVAALRGLGLSVIPGMVAFNVAEQPANTPNAAQHWHCGTSGELAYESDDARWPDIFSAVAQSGLLLKRYGNLQPVQWAKLLMNLNNPINALSQLPLLSQLMDRNYRRCVALLQDEAIATLRAASITPARLLPLPMRLLPSILRLPNWAYRRVAARMLTIDPKARSSMAEDFAKARQPEIDALCGAVVRLAAAHHRAAPANAALQRAIEDGLRHESAAALLARLLLASKQRTR